MKPIYHGTGREILCQKGLHNVKKIANTAEREIVTPYVFPPFTEVIGEQIKNKKCFRNIYAPLDAKFKITTYMYKAWLQPSNKFGIDQVKGSKDIERAHTGLERVV